MLFNKKQKTQKRLESSMLAINSMLREIYLNKSSDEYKMKGDITLSPSYSHIETMIADLKTLRGYNPKDADDITKMFNTLHRPIFKTMVKEYIMEQNDKNTLFTATFTVGYRLLVGELTRIYASTIATDKGIVYKPDKMARKTDASQMIKLYNENLERVLNKYAQDMKKYPNEAPVNEAYICMLIDQMVQEGTAYFTLESDEPDQSDKSTVGTVEEGDLSDSDQKDSSGVKPVKEEAGDTIDNTETETDGDVDAVQEGVASGLTKVATGLAGVTSTIAGYGTSIAIIGTSLGIIAGLFQGVNSLFRGFNPISEINYMFMNSYDRKINRLADVSRMYEETKKAYDEYMKNPEEQRKKRVENKYLKNMEKYNIKMQNMAAKIDHFDQRAKKESADIVNDIDSKLPGSNVKPTEPNENGAAENTSGNAGNAGGDDDFQF